MQSHRSDDVDSMASFSMDEPVALPQPPMPADKWQRKHNRFVLSALQLQKQDYYCSSKGPQINDSISICDSISQSHHQVVGNVVVGRRNTTGTTTTTTGTSNMADNNMHNNHHHKCSKPKKCVTFAVDVELTPFSAAKKDIFSWPASWKKSTASVTCY